MRILLLLGILFFSLARAVERPTIKSGVPPEFPNGLYAKYLNYIAKNMKFDLELIPMPFARRLHSMKIGQLDIMAGMQQNEESQDEFIYLNPSYETLRHTLFIMADERHKLKSFDDLTGLSIGVTINARYFQQFNEQTDLAMVHVSTLSQKIELLQKGRINTFIHFQESTLPTLKKLGLDKQVVMADFQTTERNSYYFTLSKYSPLLIYREAFEEVIRRGVEQGDFSDIRQQHYSNN